jgi:predicted metalloprotease
MSCPLPTLPVQTKKRTEKLQLSGGRKTVQSSDNNKKLNPQSTTPNNDISKVNQEITSNVECDTEEKWETLQEPQKSQLKEVPLILLVHILSQ